MLRGADRGRILLTVIFLAFIAGMGHLLILRFNAGDAYPVYSSLRSDPLGTKIFYESLGALDKIAVSRNYRPLSKLGDRTGTTLFYFGASNGLFFLGEEEARALEALPAAGNRLVILFHPKIKIRSSQKDDGGATAKEEEDRSDSERSEEESASQKEAPAPNEPIQDKREGRSRSVFLEERWNFQAVQETASNKTDLDRKPTALLQGEEPGLPDSISWHSTFYFDRLGREWKTIYAREGHPVVIERAFGTGTIVLSADTFPVSNEAMSAERHPSLLAWLVGASRSVIFDERHLGIEENPGVAALGRKYGLEGLFAAVLLLAFLYVWKNASSLVPPYADEAGRTDRATGRDSLCGFAGLLGRTIPPSDLLPVCFQEWEKTVGRKIKSDAEEGRQIRSIVEEEGSKPVRDRDPVEAYNRISKLLAERKHSQ